MQEKDYRNVTLPLGKNVSKVNSSNSQYAYKDFVAFNILLIEINV